MSQRLRSRIVVGISVFLLLFVIVGPFYYVFSASIKAPQEIIARVPTLIPHSFTLEHYQKLLRSSAFPTYLWNSVLVALGTMAITFLFLLRYPPSPWRKVTPRFSFLVMRSAILLGSSLMMKTALPLSSPIMTLSSATDEQK